MFKKKKILNFILIPYSIRPEQGNKKSSGQKDPKKPATKTKSSLTNQDKTYISLSLSL